MKKLFALLLLVVFNRYVQATEWTVNVSNFQFSPSSLNVVVGDVVKFVWVSGFHTTTSTSVPSGANTWDAPIQSPGQTFSYTVLKAGTYNYKCTPHASGGMIGSFTASPNLPVLFKDFSVNSTKSNTALLKWSTASEENTSYFAVLRSLDGENFDQIATVNAAGNSSLVQNYSYTDNSISTANSYYFYAVKTVDKDNKFTVSGTQLFRNSLAVKKLITKLSPNPVSKPGHLMLQFNADKEGSMLCQLYDAQGNMVKQTTMYAVTGVNNGHFHIGEVASGNYTIVFSLDGIRETYTIVVQ